MTARVLAVALAVALSGCARPDPAGDAPPAAAPPDTVAPSLVGSRWTWIGTQTPVEWIAPPNPSLYTIAFGSDGEVKVTVACNSGAGPWTEGEGGALAIGPVTATQAACDGSALGSEFLKELGAVAVWSLRGDTLFLDQRYDSGTMRLVLYRPPTRGAP